MGKSSINGSFSMAMLNNQMVNDMAEGQTSCLEMGNGTLLPAMDLGPKMS